jgi:hypothetical protein
MMTDRAGHYADEAYDRLASRRDRDEECKFDRELGEKDKEKK